MEEYGSSFSGVNIERCVCVCVCGRMCVVGDAIRRGVSGPLIHVFRSFSILLAFAWHFLVLEVLECST